MGKEFETPVKLKIKSQKDGFSVVIKAKVIGTEAVPLAESFIEELKTRGFITMGEKALPVEEKEANSQSELSIPICPTHHTELVKRKGQYGEFWSCPSRDDQGNWCKWKPEKEKMKAVIQGT